MTGRADILSAHMRYDVLRKSSLDSLNYRVPKGFFGNHISVDYIKSAF